MSTHDRKILQFVRLPRTPGESVEVLRARRGSRGFSLLELMVVVVLISILAVMAVPAMSGDAGDRRAFENASRIGRLLRTARTHALARGAATLVKLSTNGATDRGTFQMYEAVAANASGTGGARWPVSSCRTAAWGTLTNSSTVNFLDAVNLNGALEVQSDLRTQSYVYATATPVAVNWAYVCFTPSGRAFYSQAADATAGPDFSGGVSYLNDPLSVSVARCGGNNVAVGITRAVLLPPSGMARMVSRPAVKSGGCP